MQVMKRVNFSIPRRLAGGWKTAARWLLPNPGTIILLGVLLWAQTAGALPVSRQAATSSPSAMTMNYQGRLADSGGSPITDQMTFQFALYATDVDASPLWGPETHPNVPVSDGLFSVRLGAQVAIPQDILGGDLWLETTVNAETLSPREKLASVPYAMQANLANAVPDGAVESRHARLTTGRVAAIIGGGYLELTEQYQDVPGTTFVLSPETDQTYLVYVNADFEAMDCMALAQLHVDGEYQPGLLIFQSRVDRGRATVSQALLVSLTAGPHTVVLKAKRGSGTEAKIYATHTAITYFAVSQ